MDTILKGILSSNHPELMKRQLIKKIADKGSKPQSVNSIHSVLTLATSWILEGESEFAVDQGFIVFKTWAKYNITTLEEFCSRDYLLSLLSKGHRNDSNAPLLLVEFFSLLQLSQSYLGHVKIIEAKAISYVREHPDLSCLRNFMQCLIKFSEAIPKGDFTSTFCVSVIHSLSTCNAPVDPSLGPRFVTDVEATIKALNHIWKNTDSQTLLKSLNAVFAIISSLEEFEPSICFGALVQYIPSDVMKILIKNALDDPNIDNGSMAAALQRIVDWLQWPVARNVDVLVIYFLKGLASMQKYSILIIVTENKVEQVFSQLKYACPSRKSSLNVLSHMLLSFQHSSDLFHKILPQVPELVSVFRDEKSPGSQDCLQQLVELLHCLMYIHAGFPELYDPVLELIKDFPAPSVNVIKTKVAQYKWTSQNLENSPSPSKVTRSETGKNGLFNLGNTCYMNSVLQALFMCDDFRRTVLTCPPTPSDGMLVKLQYVFAYLSLSQRPAYAPVNFLRAARPPWFTSGHQQDCSEFLKFLLDQLHEQEISGREKKEITATEKSTSTDDITKVSNSSSDLDSDDVPLGVSPSHVPKPVPSLVEKGFGGKLTTILTCLNCKTESSRTEMFTDLPLAFPDYQFSCQKSLAGGDNKTSTDEPDTSDGSVSNGKMPLLHLSDLLQHFLQPEKLTGDNQYHCDKCQGLQDGEKTIKIAQGPEYLVLTLMRFSYDTKLHSRCKIFREVKYPKTLVLPVDSGHKRQKISTSNRKSLRGAVIAQLGQCGVAVDSPQADIYSLCGVVVHSGTSSDCGHYYCYARHSISSDPDSVCDGLSKCNDEDEIDFLQDQWYLFNDSRVSYASYSSFSNVTQRFTKDTAYVLFYRRVNPDMFQDNVDLNESIHPVHVDPPLRADLRAAINRDNSLYLQEQEMAAKKATDKKKARPSSISWYNWRDEDEDKGPPGSCGGGGHNGLDMSGARFVF